MRTSSKQTLDTLAHVGTEIRRRGENNSVTAPDILVAAPPRPVSAPIYTVALVFTPLASAEGRERTLSPRRAKESEAPSAVTCGKMDSQRPGGLPSGTPPGKGDGNRQNNQQGGRQEVVDIFGSDMMTGVLTLVLLLLGLMSASMTRCICI